MNRRQFITTCLGLAFSLLIASRTFGADMNMPITIEKIVKSDAEWRKLLTPAQYDILRREGTEQPFSSPLNDEKRLGQYVCAGCEASVAHIAQQSTTVHNRSHKSPTLTLLKQQSSTQEVC